MFVKYSEQEYRTGCRRSDSESVLPSGITVPTMLHGLWSHRNRRNYNKSIVPSTHMDERVEAVRRRLLERGFTGIRRPDGTIAELNRDYLDLTHSFWSDSFPNVIIGHDIGLKSYILLRTQAETIAFPDRLVDLPWYRLTESVYYRIKHQEHTKQSLRLVRRCLFRYNMI